MGRPEREKKAVRRIAGIFTAGQVIAIAVCLVLSVACYTGFRMAGIAIASIPETLVCPGGNLGDTVFDAQNTYYTADADYPGSLYIPGTGYMVDVPDAVSARVGSGTIYRLSQNVYLYITAFAHGEDAGDVCCREAAPALCPGADPGSSSCGVAKTEHGYFNGYEVSYQVLRLSMSAGGTDSEAAVVSYTFYDEDSGLDLFFSAVTRTITNRGLAYARNLAAHELDLFRKVPEEAP